MKKRVLIKGAGDLASGIALRLFHCGYAVIMTELKIPTTVRRTAAFSPAVYLGKTQVEDVTAVCCDSLKVAEDIINHHKIAVLVDEDNDICGKWKPDVVVDAILAKKNLGTRITDAATVIGVGPGFTAGEDCHCVVETKRGHYLGRCIWQGSAIPNTGVPGDIGGYTRERLIQAPADGVFFGTAEIGTVVHAGDPVGYVGETPVCVRIDGVLRGLLQDGVPVTKGMKAGDVDPRCQVSHCYTVSDKASAIGGGVLEAILCHEQKRQVALVLLAAGDSCRFGSNKLLARIGGKPMYRHLADELALLPADFFSRRLAVSQYPEVLTDLASEGFEVVENTQSELGISHSVRLALQALRQPSHTGYSAVCFAVCDQPWLRVETIMRLIREWSVSGKGLGCLSCGETDGNPAVFARCYEEELLSLTGDVGGRAVIRRHPDDLFRCEITDSRELEDIDFMTNICL